jgi:hypothetical protein
MKLWQLCQTLAIRLAWLEESWQTAKLSDSLTFRQMYRASVLGRDEEAVIVSAEAAVE